MMTDDFLNAIR